MQDMNIDRNLAIFQSREEREKMLNNNEAAKNLTLFNGA